MDRKLWETKLEVANRMLIENQKEIDIEESNNLLLSKMGIIRVDKYRALIEKRDMLQSRVDTIEQVLK